MKHFESVSGVEQAETWRRGAGMEGEEKQGVFLERNVLLQKSQSAMAMCSTSQCLSSAQPR